MQDVFRFPPIDGHLLAALRRAFPQPAISHTDGISKIMFEAGQQSVIAMLAKTLEEQHRRSIPNEEDDD